jgi:hypothetical protein
MQAEKGAREDGATLDGIVAKRLVWNIGLWRRDGMQ